MTGPGPALERVLRVMSFGIGIAGIIFGGIRTPDIIAQLAVYGPLWTIVAVVAFIGPAVALVPLSFRAPLKVLRALALIAGAAFVLVGLAAPYTLAGGVLPEGAPAPWVLTVSALATSVVAIWLPALPTTGYLVVVVVIVEGVRVVLLPDSDLRLVLLDTAYTALFNLIFAVLAITLRSVAARVDSAAELAVAEARAAAGAEARNRERARIAALIHDRVLVTLLSAAGPDRSRRNDLSLLATSALELFDPPEDRASASVTARELTWRIQSIATEVIPLATFTHELEDPDLRVPAEAAEALVEAAAEAMRNSARHADLGVRAPASRAVNVDAGMTGFEVTVLDDGSGFDPAGVPPDRLGIAVSIRSRMAAIPGGAAFVVSRPGIGTRVVARWSPHG